MTKQIIAIDLDDVLGAENEAVRLFANERYGLNHAPEDYLADGDYGSYWEGIWRVDETEAKKRYEEYVAAGGKYHHELIPGTEDAVIMLKQHYELVIVTVRGNRHIEATKKWVQRHFPDVFKGIEFVPLWDTADKKATKASICEKIGASYLIDDHIGHCRLAAEAGIQCLLFGDYGWNRKVDLPPRVVRARDWQEVLEYFDAK